MKAYRAYPYIFVGPAVVLLLVFYIWPIFLAAIISFTDMDLAGLNNFAEVGFIGFENYKSLITDEEFANVLKNTFYYVIIGVPLVVLFSLTIATAINALSNKMGQVFRSLYYIPSITNIVAISFIWMFMYSTSSGLFNYILMNYEVIQEPIGWLTDPNITKLSLIAVALWRGIGLNMIILLAGLTAIPKDYYEAASIDGAGAIRKYRKITLPQMRYAIFFVIVTTTIGWMQFFDEVYIMVERESANATSIALYIYEQGFSLNNYGYASAASIVLLAIIICITVIQLRFNKEKS